VGGVKNVYIGAYSDSTAFTIDVDGTISLVTGTESFYTFKSRPQTSSFTEEGTHSVENGTNFWTQTVSMVFHKMDSAKRATLLSLAKTSMHVIVEDQNGIYWVVGLANGATMATSAAQTGMAYGDLSGYNISLVGMEAVSATELSAVAFATLTVVA
jgi:hypothetical protein